MDDYCQPNAAFPLLYTYICQQICDIIDGDSGQCSYWSYDQSTFMCSFYQGYANPSVLYLNNPASHAGTACRVIEPPVSRRLSSTFLPAPPSKMLAPRKLTSVSSELVLNFWAVSGSFQKDHVMRTSLTKATEKFRSRFNSSCTLEYLETAPTEKVFEIRIATLYDELEHSKEDFKQRLCNAVGDAIDGLSGLRAYKCNKKIFVLGTYKEPETGNIVSVFKITDNFGKVQAALRTRKGALALRNKLSLFGLATLSAAVEIPESSNSGLGTGVIALISVTVVVGMVIAGVAVKKFRERDTLHEGDRILRYVSYVSSKNQVLRQAPV